MVPSTSFGFGASGAGDGDWAAVHELVARIVARHWRDHHEREEIVQETLLRLWRARASLRAARDKRAWITTLAVNEIRRHSTWRARQSATLSEQPVETLTGMSPAAGVERLHALEILSGMQPIDQQLMLLHHYGDLPLSEVARRSGLPLGTVKARLHRARSSAIRRHAATVAA